MPLKYYRWKEPEILPESVEEELSGFSSVIKSVLYHRGFKTIKRAGDFLNPKELKLNSSHQLRQIDSACEIIKEAVRSKSKILVFGDYDADGITSSAVLTLALKKISGDVLSRIPNRFSSGYGLNKDLINNFHDEGIDLVITVDNGIRSHSVIDYAKSLEMKVIVTDHHNPGTDLPRADAVINPKSPDDNYPNKHLAGVGVAYKLVCALAKHFPEINPADYIDLVAIGTVADVVPLLGENRFLVMEGLSSINNNFYPRQSIRSLLGAANISGQKISSSDISFQIAPRLNASGRLDIADRNHPLQLLLSSNPAICGTLAQEIEVHNFDRKRLSKDLQEKIENSLNIAAIRPKIIISFAEDNHLGVAGIAAGYMTNNYYLPTIIGQIGPEFTTASCRSIPEFNIINALDNCGELFIRYGGHALAAGFTIENDKLSQLQSCLTSQAEDQLADSDLKPTISIDSIIDLEQITADLITELEIFEPTGSSNPQPIFLTRGLRCVKKSLVCKGFEHLRMSVSNGNTSFNTIGFNLGEFYNSLENTFDMVYKISENHYRGNTEVQLQVVDIKLS